jgi:hypothetical protein
VICTARDAAPGQSRAGGANKERPLIVRCGGPIAGRWRSRRASSACGCLPALRGPSAPCAERPKAWSAGRRHTQRVFATRVSHKALRPSKAQARFLQIYRCLCSAPRSQAPLTARLFWTTETMMRGVPGMSRTHPHEQPTMSVPPPVEGWPTRQYPRPPTSLLWGVKPPSQQPSEWSDAWTVKEAARRSDMTKETTLFLVNPGRHFLSSCDVTSPRSTRRGFGLNTKEFYAIVEPLKTPPPSREAKLVLRHGPVGRARGKYDSRTCQLGFGIVEVNYLFSYMNC